MYYFGRTLQVIGLVLLPSAIWAAEVLHSEAACLSVFGISCTLFVIGMMICKSTKS